MFEWMLEYWYLCLIALTIGVVTGWWIWARPAPAELAAPEPIAVPAAKPVPPKPLEPVRPDIVPAEPARFAAVEPVVTAPPPPAATGGPAIAPAVGAPDNLRLIKGIGPKLDTLLASLGVLRFDQIAAWTDADIAEVDPYLGSFKGRIGRDNWVDQAGYLARGDRAGFEAKYGALGGEG